ncbi:hypothetical protein VB779_09325 [Haloarculaceae archaeon H-GB11]|nr:hypothetical protein [Haloarculaceae archaeon H-GB11]
MSVRDKLRGTTLAILLIVASLAGAFPVGSASAQSGMVSIPDSNIHDVTNGTAPVSRSDLSGSVMTTDHAETLEVSITTGNRSMGPNATRLGDGEDLVLVFSDDVHDAGRTVAVPAGAVREALGYRPAVVYGYNSDGSEWESRVRAEGNLYVFEIPHFSSNTVEFAGEVEILGQPASDGSSYSYSVSDRDVVEDYHINITGRTNYETETESGTVSNGNSLPISVAGTADPLGPNGTSPPELELTGVETTSAFSTSGTASDGDSVGISLAGNQPPENATVTFTGAESTTNRTITAANMANGDTTSYTVNGNLPATGAEVTFTGDETSSAESATGTGGDPTITVDGNLEPTNMQVTFTGQTQTNARTITGSGGPDLTKSISVGGIWTRAVHRPTTSRPFK